MFERKRRERRVRLEKEKSKGPKSKQVLAWWCKGRNGEKRKWGGFNVEGGEKKIIGWSQEFPSPKKKPSLAGLEVEGIRRVCLLEVGGATGVRQALVSLIHRFRSGRRQH